MLTSDPFGAQRLGQLFSPGTALRQQVARACSRVLRSNSAPPSRAPWNSQISSSRAAPLRRAIPRQLEGRLLGLGGVDDDQELLKVHGQVPRKKGGVPRGGRRDCAQPSRSAE